MVFIELGIGLMFGAIAYVVFVIGKSAKNSCDLDHKYLLLEECTLDKIASKKGIDLNKERIARDVFKQKNFRKTVQEQVMSEWNKKN